MDHPKLTRKAVQDFSEVQMDPPRLKKVSQDCSEVQMDHPILMMNKVAALVMLCDGHT